MLPAIIVLALALRFIYLFEISSTPLFHFLAADTGSFERFALEILNGDLFSPETIYFNPLYPFFLTLIYRIFGHHLFAVVICQALLDTAICLILYGVCRQVFRDRVVGLIAAFVYAGYGLAIFYTGIVLGASLASFLFVLTVYLLLLAGERDLIPAWLGAGIAFGLCCLIRPNTLIVLPFIVIWILFSRRGSLKLSRRLIRSILLLSGFLVMLLPFSFRYYRITGVVTLPFGNGGLNFYVGNHKGAGGTYSYLSGISNTPTGQIRSSVTRIARETGKEADLREASAHWLNKGLDFIREEPLEYLSLMGRKFLLFWNVREIGQNIDYVFSKRFAPLLRFPWFSFGLIAPFAWLGLFCVFRRRLTGPLLPALLLIAYMGSVIIFFVSARYRFPAIPFIIIFAAYGANYLIRIAVRFRRRTLKQLLPPLGVLAGAFVVAYLPLSPFEEEKYLSWSHTMLGNVYCEQGLIERGIAEYHRALEFNPGDTIALNQLGSAHWKAGRRDKAVLVFLDAIAADPGDVSAHNNLGAVLAEMGMIEEAVEEFREALRIDPDAPESHSNLAVYYLYYRNNPGKSAYHANRARELGYDLPDQLESDLSRSSVH